MSAITQKTVHANGLDFAYLEAGTGPLVLLLHGFPDNAWTWQAQLEALASQGWRAVAPWLRGYAPTQVPSQPYYDRITLAQDVRELIGALNHGEPAHIVAQDWGAAITYGVLAMYPQAVRSAVVMAIPHVKAALGDALSPVQIQRAFHWWFFQIDGMAEQAVPLNDYAFIDFLWRDWSPKHQEEAHLAQIKRMLAEPGCLSASVGYYRALLRSDYRNPAHAALWPQLDAPIASATLALCGADDVRAEVMSKQADFFCGDYRYLEVPDTGHFLHREAPEAINALLLAWLAEQANTAPAQPLSSSFGTAP